MESFMNSSSAAKDIERAILKAREDRRQELERQSSQELSESAETHVEDDVLTSVIEDNDRKSSGGKCHDTTGDDLEQKAKGEGQAIKGEVTTVEDISLKDIESGTSGPSKIKKPLSAKNFARFKEMGKQLVAEGLKVEDSYSLDLVTVEQQAAREPDFVGKDTDWYNFRYEGVHQKIDGEYLIVWTRDMGTTKDDRSAVKVFEISMKNCINVYSKSREYDNDHYLTSIFSAGNFAAIKLCADGKELDMAVMKEKEDECLANVVVLGGVVDQERCTSFLQEVICTGIQDKGSMIAFGIKIVGELGTTLLGFEFVEIFLDYMDPLSKETGILEVVAVKIPKGGNVASAFILKQKLSALPDPKWLLREDDAEDGDTKEGGDVDIEMLV